MNSMFVSPPSLTSVLFIFSKSNSFIGVLIFPYIAKQYILQHQQTHTHTLILQCTVDGAAVGFSAR